MRESGLHARLRDVVGQRSYRILGEITGMNAETARRYMNGAAPSVEFLAAICEKFGVNGEWLVTGRGPVHLKDAKQHALQQASAGELLQSVARAIERLTDRVDRVEVFVQTLETRLWSRLQESGGSTGSLTNDQQATNPPGNRPASQARRPSPQAPQGAAERGRDAGGAGQARRGRGGPSGGGAAANTPTRPGWVADAVPERPSEDAP